MAKKKGSKKKKAKKAVKKKVKKTKRKGAKKVAKRKVKKAKKKAGKKVAKKKKKAKKKGKKAKKKGKKAAKKAKGYLGALGDMFRNDGSRDQQVGPEVVLHEYSSRKFGKRPAPKASGRSYAGNPRASTATVSNPDYAALKRRMMGGSTR